jgi:hypothetical protein
VNMPGPEFRINHWKILCFQKHIFKRYLMPEMPDGDLSIRKTFKKITLGLQQFQNIFVYVFSIDFRKILNPLSATSL